MNAYLESRTYKDFEELVDKFDNGNNRNSTLHGYMHSRFWIKESFEELIHFIACGSKYAGF